MLWRRNAVGKPKGRHDCSAHAASLVALIFDLDKKIFIKDRLYFTL